MPRTDPIDDKKVVEDKSVVDPRNHNTPDNATRRLAALNAKIAGASYSEIAEMYGYGSPASARRAIERACAEAAASDDDRDKVRWLLDQRLERLWTSVSRRAVDPSDPAHLDYAAAALRIIDRKMNLFQLGGTNVVITPSADRVREVVTQIESLITSGEQAEADIMDAEVIEERADA